MCKKSILKYKRKFVYQVKYLFVMNPEIPTTLENGGEIMVMDHEGAHYANAFISNEPSLGEVYAPEINWYSLYSSASQSEQHATLELLYDLRQMRHTLVPKTTQSVKVPRSIAIIGDKESEEVASLTTLSQYYFDEISCIDSQNLASISGKLGHFEIKANEKEGVVFGQIIISDSNANAPRLTGIEWANEYTEQDYLMKSLRNRAGIFNYPSRIRYDGALCDTDMCQKCRDICPQDAIEISSIFNKVNIAQLECTGCGECLHVCPTRALDYIPFTQAMLQKTVQKCANKRLVIIPSSALESLRDIELPQGIVPLVVEGCGGFTDWHWLVMLQELGKNVIVYDTKMPEPTKKSIYFINELYRRIHGKEAILWTNTLEDFKNALLCEEDLPIVRFDEIKEPNDDFKRRFIALTQALHVKNKEGEN